jgi:hypothetical protein
VLHSLTAFFIYRRVCVTWIHQLTAFAVNIKHPKNVSTGKLLIHKSTCNILKWCCYTHFCFISALNDLQMSFTFVQKLTLDKLARLKVIVYRFEQNAKVNLIIALLLWIFSSSVIHNYSERFRWSANFVIYLFIDECSKWKFRFV